MSASLLLMVCLSHAPSIAQEAAAPDTTPQQKKAAADPLNPTTTSVALVPSEADSDASSSDYNNWVTFGGGDTFVRGDSWQFKHEHDTNSGPTGGVEDFHGQLLIGKDATFTADGHGIFGSHDYDLKLDLTDDSLGYVRAGHSEFRTWYNGNGGFYPIGEVSYLPDIGNLYVDRSSTWIEAGLTLPDLPVFNIRYEYDSRVGQKDSTSWGPSLGTTQIVPSFLGVNETRNIISAGVSDTVGATEANLALRYEIDRTDDSTNINNFPGQSFQSYITNSDVERNDLFSVHASSISRLDPMVTFSIGNSFTTIDTNLSGSRIYGPTYNAPFSPSYPNNGTGLVDLGGGGNTKDSIVNANLMISPIKDLVIVPTLRTEYQTSSLADSYSMTPFISPYAATADNWYLNIAESLEVRYTGLRDWSFYTSAEWAEDGGNTVWDEGPALVALAPSLNQDWTRFGQKYTVGFNWYPLSQLNFGGQYYHQIHDYNYDNRQTNMPVSYPGYFQQRKLTLDDLNIRATWSLLANLSLITSYDFQYSTVKTGSIPAGGTEAGEVDSSNISNHILSENINWAALPCVYFQVGGSYVINSVDTPVAGSAGINNLVLNGGNNYWTLDASTGYDINKKTHLQLQYTYYNADNYVNSAPSSQPYGATDQEHVVSATLTRQISEAVQLTLKYSYFRNRDITSGGQNNYDAQLVYLGTQFKF